MVYENKAAEHLQEAYSAMQNGNYELALSIFWLFSDKGDAEASFCLGFMYAAGDGVAQDYKQAGTLIRKSAEQGYAPSQYFLAEEFRSGAKNSQKALEWYLKAAEQEYDFAQNNLGLIYLHGLGIPQDYKEAFKWISKAANHGRGTSQSILASMYLNGQGTPQDISQAIKWYLSAAQQGDTEAIFVAEILNKSPNFLHLFSNISASDHSILVAFYKAYSPSQPPSIFSTIKDSANYFLWSEMQKLGWMIEVPIDSEIVKAAGKISETMRNFSITELGLDKIKQLLSL